MCKIPYNPPTIRQCITNNFSQMDLKNINFMVLGFLVSHYCKDTYLSRSFVILALSRTCQKHQFRGKHIALLDAINENTHGYTIYQS